MEPPKIPRYELKHVYDDGTESEPEIVPVTRLPWNTRMKRRSIFGVGVAAGATLAFLLGKNGGENGGGQQAVAEEVSDGNARAHKNSISKVVITPDSKTLISGSTDGTIKFWKLPSGALFKTLEADKSGVLSLAIAPDGKILASGGRNGEIKVWNLPEATLRKTWQAHENEPVLSLAISPDSSILASGSSDGNIKLWNLPEGTLIESLKASQRSVNAIAISPNGHILASGNGDGTDLFIFSF